MAVAGGWGNLGDWESGGLEKERVGLGMTGFFGAIEKLCQETSSDQFSSSQTFGDPNISTT